MATASAQSSLDDKKPKGDCRIRTEMQASTHIPAPKGGFPAMQKADREFDLWLQRELGRLHGDVLHEPIPEKLLRILEDASKPRD